MNERLYCRECHEALPPGKHTCKACCWTTPEGRAERALATLRVYQPSLKTVPHPEDVRAAMVDVIADLHHLLDRTAMSDVRDIADAVTGRDTHWDRVTDSALLHYEAEHGLSAMTHLDLEEWQADRADRMRERGE